MFRLRDLSPDATSALAAEQRGRNFTYPDVGLTRTGDTPEGWARDHNRVRLGSGEACWGRAREALRTWRMFDLGWVRVAEPAPPIAAGEVAVVCVRSLGLSVLNASRIVYVLEEEGPVCRFGFAYGTLPAHAERGEERFLVEWDRESDEVWYEILAFSRPGHPLVWLGYPWARSQQRRFARDSKAVMLRAAG